MLPSSEDRNNVTLRKQRITRHDDSAELINVSDGCDMASNSEIRMLREQITIMNITLAKVVDSVQRAHEKIDLVSTKLSDIDERILNIENSLSAPKPFESPQVEKSKRKRRKSKSSESVTDLPDDDDEATASTEHNQDNNNNSHSDKGEPTATNINSDHDDNDDAGAWQHLGFNSLETRRNYQLTLTVCRIIRGEYDCPELVSEALQLYVPDSYMRGRRHKLLALPSCRTTQVIFQHYVMSNSDENFSKASEFMPERWLKRSSVQNHHPFASLPFGFGRRMCLGRRFAELEIHTVIAKMVQAFQMEYHHEPLEYHVHPMYTPNGPIRLKLIDR
ncbi:cytochrome p450 domain-containing protein [Phthorimaea operculella]|nr:cytochrome p450 domain-containing protein [Phthorimaea operculella]